MKKNWMFAGLVATIIMVATLGVAIAQNDPMMGSASGEQVNEYDQIMDEMMGEDAQYLITNEQMMEIRNETRNMIREQIRANLMSYNLTDDQIMEIEELMEAIMELRQEAFETHRELMEQGLSRKEIRAEMRPMVLEIQELRAQLKDTLAEYGVDLPEPPIGRGRGMFGPGMGLAGKGRGMGGPSMGRLGDGGPGNCGTEMGGSGYAGFGMGGP